MTTWLAALTIQCLAFGGAAPVPEAGRDTLPTLEEVLERHIEAVGGRAAIERLTTLYATDPSIQVLQNWFSQSSTTASSPP